MPHAVGVRNSRPDKRTLHNSHECFRYFPGHIHAFYLEYVYYNRREQGRLGTVTAERAPGVYSENVQSGGRTTYGTVTT